jgi:hypothetical protein
MYASFFQWRPWTVLLLAFFIAPISSAVAQAEGEVSVVYDSSAIETGEPFRVYLRITPVAVQPVATDLSPWLERIPQENLLAQTPWERHGQEWGQSLTLIFFEASEMDLPPLPIVLLQGDTLWTGPVRLSVFPTPTPDEETAWKDIKTLWLTPGQGWERWRWLMVTGVGLLITGVVVYWLLLRRPRVVRKQVRSLHAWTLEQLSALEHQRLWARGEMKAYYTDLSRIMREYLERQYGFPALESSTEEVLDHCRKHSLPPQLLPALEELLRWCDLVKFARATPPEYYHAQAMREARRIVEQTALALAPTSEETPSNPEPL